MSNSECYKDRRGNNYEVPFRGARSVLYSVKTLATIESWSTQDRNPKVEDQVAEHGNDALVFLEDRQKGIAVTTLDLDQDTIRKEYMVQIVNPLDPDNYSERFQDVALLLGVISDVRPIRQNTHKGIFRGIECVRPSTCDSLEPGDWYLKLEHKGKAFVRIPVGNVVNVTEVDL